MALYYLHPNVNIHIPHTVLSTFSMAMTRRIYLTIRSFLNWWSFPQFVWSLHLIQGWDCKEKLEANNSQELINHVWGSKNFICVIPAGWMNTHQQAPLFLQETHLAVRNPWDFSHGAEMSNSSTSPVRLLSSFLFFRQQLSSPGRCWGSIPLSCHSWSRTQEFLHSVHKVVSSTGLRGHYRPRRHGKRLGARVLVGRR